MPDIHASAVVAPGADIAPDVEIGPYCVIGAHVTIEPGCRLIAHVHVTGHTTIGARTVVYPFASLGTPPQSVKYRGGPTRLNIGADCDLREAVTMNIGTEDGGGLTEVGHRCFFMTGSHVGHDCRVGNDVVFANNATLGGHVVIGDNVILAGLSAVHQFGRVGEGAMIAGLAGVRGDIIPFGVAANSYAELVGLNVVGLRRRGVSRTRILGLRRAYRMLFFGEGVFRDRLDTVARAFAEEPLVDQVIAFIRAGGARPLTGPSGRGTGNALRADAAS
jgi:UDP-N-acetylglucosamine acyltransferase